MAIKIVGRDVTLTGKHADFILELAKEEGVTPQIAFNRALRRGMKMVEEREKARKKK